jgi:hypothetical protein
MFEKSHTGKQRLQAIIIIQILQYEKLVLEKDGLIKKSEFFVEGCKHPLKEIR